MTSAITATGLRKSFGGKIVLDGIDLEVGAGTTFSLLDPSGAGKTTTVQIMSTLVHADGKRTEQRFTGWVRWPHRTLSSHRVPGLRGRLTNP